MILNHLKLERAAFFIKRIPNEENRLKIIFSKSNVIFCIQFIGAEENNLGANNYKTRKFTKVFTSILYY